jgi:hypothetical protein
LGDLGLSPLGTEEVCALAVLPGTRIGMATRRFLAPSVDRRCLRIAGLTISAMSAIILLP